MTCKGCGADVGNGSIDQCDVHNHLNRTNGQVEVTYTCPDCTAKMEAAIA